MREVGDVSENLPTLAAQLGMTVHLSPLLKKAERLGLSVPGDLERLAIQRGCRYYAPGEESWLSCKEDEGLRERGRRLSKAELAIALLSICLPKSQHRLRLGACLLATPGLSHEEIIRLAKQERVETVVRHIGNCGRNVEPDEFFWKALMDSLGPADSANTDPLPHISRFVAMTGLTRRGRETVMQWIRPRECAEMIAK